MEYIFLHNDDLQGMKIVVSGPFNRHGRTHIFSYTLGYMEFNSHDSHVLYDMVHSPTYFGMISFKIWVSYRQDPTMRLMKHVLVRAGMKLPKAEVKVPEDQLVFIAPKEKLKANIVKAHAKV